MNARHLVALVLVAAATVALFLECAGRETGSWRAEAERAAKARDDALHALDTLRASHAQREVRDQKHADSLRALIARAYKAGRDTHLIIRADTVLVPVAEYVYVRDTVLPACLVCAARLDSSVAANRIERTAATTALDASNAWGTQGYRLYYAEQRHAKRYKVATGVALIGGVVLGAWVRGSGR